MDEWIREICQNNSYVIGTGENYMTPCERVYDFIVFNLLNIPIGDCEATMSEGTLPDSPFWRQLRGITWSCQCRFFFVISDDQIVVGNCLNNNAFISNVSIRIFQFFVDTAFERKGSSRYERKSGWRQNH